MSKLSLIVKREYLRRVNKKSFIILTLIMPFLMAAMIFVPLWLSTIKGSDIRQVAVLDTTGKYASLFENTENYHFIQGEQSLEDYRNSSDKEIFAFLNITDDLLVNPKAATLYSEKQIPGELSRLINQALTKQLEDEKLASYNIPELKTIIKESQINFSIQTIKWGEDGSEKESSAMLASIIGIIFTMVIYMFIMIYGAMVMQGVMEEKTNRIVELMISSVRPFDLMMGKIMGIGLVGLTQIFLWGILTVALITGGGYLFGADASIDPAAMQAQVMAGSAEVQQAMAQDPIGSFLGKLDAVNLFNIGIYFVIYFIGGYMLYAALFAAFGSAVDSQEDTQQFIMPITILMVFALYSGIYSMENPDGPLAFWCSMIPFTSPIVMMVRIPFEIPLWEKILSVVILYGSFIGITWISAKIYRIGILMYGKKPSIKEMIKWIKYK